MRDLGEALKRLKVVGEMRWQRIGDGQRLPAMMENGLQWCVGVEARSGYL